LAIGISKPHLPWFVPQKYFDMYDLENIVVPEYFEDDLKDIKTPNGKQKFVPSDDFKRVKAAGKFKEATRAYLAAVTSADDCIGVMLETLRNSQYADNTIVVVWGDHGWFLGEKLRYRKTHLWEESTRCPLIMNVPGVTQSSDCNRVVNLMDLYPTLNDLCGLPAKTDIAGRSLKPLLQGPKTKWDYPTLTTMQSGNHAIRNERWRYIRYVDGTEELYDCEKDPMEWNNLAGKKEHAKIQQELKKWLPKQDAPNAPRNTFEKKKPQKGGRRRRAR
jgi:arylsulfatase A-like enzyme